MSQKKKRRSRSVDDLETSSPATAAAVGAYGATATTDVEVAKLCAHIQSMPNNQKYVQRVSYCHFFFALLEPFDLRTNVFQVNDLANVSSTAQQSSYREPLAFQKLFRKKVSLSADLLPFSRLALSFLLLIFPFSEAAVQVVG